uniref:SH2 domain-containing protein n=1 Tax=Macrostomum lignano TaxID=282301 RepID=A0A1I8GQE0_9PLAT
MKQATDSGVYMLRGFCNSQAGQDKTLCVKYSMVYKFRIRVLQEGYQIWNEHNSTVHSSMEALLFYHHLFPIRDGTYTLRFDPDSGGAVLCVTHRCQILKFRVVASMTADNRREFGFHHLPTVPKFGSLEEFIVHHHKNPIRGSSADGDIILKMPFQLVPRCQQELDFQQISLDAAIFTTGSVAAVSNKVARMRSGNFLVLRRSQQPLLQQPGESESTDSSAAAGAGVEHSLVVRDDHGSVKTFRIVERDTDLSFRPQKTFTLAERPELVTDRIEKMVHFLCIASKFLSPEITLLVKP